MDAILNIFGFISGLGVSVVMPIVITILGLAMGAGFGKSLRAGLTVGIGFIGLNLIIGGLLGTNLAPAVQMMIENFGIELSIIDVGWPAASAIAMGSVVGAIIIPLGLIVNIVMLLTNTTQTVDVDIWNYWHFAFTGALVAIVCESIPLGIIAAILNMVIVMVLGDLTAPQVEKSLGLPGVSLPHGFTAAYAPIAMAINWLIEKIPGVRDIDINVDKLQEKFGIFGEPMIIGTVIGLGIGALAYYNQENAASMILNAAISFGAVLVLIPKMAALLMEGLIPVSDAASAFVQKRFASRGKIYIGLDSAVGVGHPTTLTISYILVPLLLLLAVVLPGNNVLPFVDLAVVPFMFVLITPIVNNNGFRGLIVGIVVLAVGLYVATDLAPLITSAAANAGFDIAAATGDAGAMISSICDGANPLTWVITRAMGYLGYAGLALVAVVALGMAFYNRKRILAEAKAMHEAEAEVAEA